MSKDLGAKVLEKIKEKKLRPKPKWEFLLKNYIIWGFSFLSLIIGSLASSVIFYMLIKNDWDFYMDISSSMPRFIFATLPYFWILFLLIFVVVINYNLKHTKKGYRYKLHYIVVGSVVFSIILGGLFYNIGVGQAIDDKLSEKVPLYTKYLNRRVQMWTNPERGLLSGIIISINSDKNFIIKDFKERIWNITADGAYIAPMIKVEEGKKINMFGKMQEGIDDELSFAAKKILPMGPGKGQFKRLRDPRMHLKEKLNRYPEVINKEDVIR